MAEMSLAPKMLLIMASVMVFLGLAQYAIDSMATGVSFFDYGSTMGATFTTDGTLETDLAVGYEESSSVSADSVDETTGSVYTDTFKSLGGWWEKQEARFGLATSILRQPAGFLKDIGIPMFLVNVFGIVWYMMASIAVIMLFTGRN